MKIGPLLNMKLSSLALEEGTLDWDNEVKYLDVIINAGKNYS